MSSLEKIYSDLLPVFKWVVWFFWVVWIVYLQFNCVSCLCILDNNLLTVIWPANILSHSLGWFLFCWCFSLLCKKLLISFQFFNFAFIIVCIYVIFKLVLHSFLPDFQSHDILGFSSYATLSQNIFLFFFPISLPNQIYWKSIYWNVKKDSSIEIYSNVILYNFENKKPNFQSVALTSPDSRVLGSLSQVHLLWRFSMTMSKNRALFWAPSSEFLDDLRGNSCHLPSAFFLPEKWGKCHLLIFRKVRRLMRGQWSLQACTLQRQVPWT